MSATSASLLDQLLTGLDAMDPEQLEAIDDDIQSHVGVWEWVPNPGPQTMAVESKADELFYGGEAGGGKSDLLIGLALTQHYASRLLRRYVDDVRDMGERMCEILDTRDGYNGQLMRWMDEQSGRRIDFSGCKDEKDKQRYKGRARDFFGFDEIGDFSEAMFRFITAWNRSARHNQRCRVVATGNPPTEATGLWVIEYWAPWLDPDYADPLGLGKPEQGELRWFTHGEDGHDIEVDGPGPHLIGGEQVYARSRTFIRARLSDNPDLTQDHQYESALAALPEEYRRAYRDGVFDAGIRDNPFQCIPTAWVKAAQARWKPQPPGDCPMSCIALDPSQGGDDDNAIAKRHDGWYDEIVTIPGKQTPPGVDASPQLIVNRRDGAEVVVDCGGGYGGGIVKTLRENDIKSYPWKGAETSTARSADKAKLKFANKRSQAYWQFREALDPQQPYGSPIFLPPDRELLADLTCLTYTIGKQGVQVEPKDKLVQRIGRSPNKGDAVVMAWQKGNKGNMYHYLGLGSSKELGIKNRNKRPQVKLGRDAQRRHTRRH